MMDTFYLTDILRVLFVCFQHNPGNLIPVFDASKSIAAFDYDLNTKKFTRVSQSVLAILGNNLLCTIQKGNTLKDLIHPSDTMQFLSYFNITSPISNISHPECKSYFFNSMACRIKHENGFWKYLEFVSFDYRYSPNNTLHKCGFIADGLFQTEMANALAIKNSKLPRNIPHTSTTVTKRESEVLNLIGKGLIAKEIARNLNISVTTVISHRKNLISKLQVKNTAELIKQATKLMLI